MSDYRNRQNWGFESKEAKRAQKPLAKGVPPFHELLMPVTLKQNLHAFAPTSPPTGEVSPHITDNKILSHSSKAMNSKNLSLGIPA